MPRDIGSSFLPLELFDIDIGQPLPSLKTTYRPDGTRYERAFALIRLHGQPLGHLELDLCAGGMTAEELAKKTWGQLRSSIAKHLEDDGMGSVSVLTADGLQGHAVPPCCLLEEEFPFVSVVIPTRGRPGSLATCLDSFRTLEYPRYELIIVDSAPTSTANAEVSHWASYDLPQIRYVVEKMPGSSRARNRGVAESEGEIIAFTDDDVVVDSHWLAGLVRGFQLSADVACVTGLVLAAEFETPAQLWFEQYGGFSRGYVRKVFSLESRSGATSVFPYNAGAFGAGASMAFRASVLRAFGGFDTSLGPGTPAKGGEDLDVFFRVIKGGHRLAYEPSSVAWHSHRREYHALRRQIHDYGVGLAAFITKRLFNPETVLGMIKRLPCGLVLLLSPSSPKNVTKVPGYPRRLSIFELAGILRGPLAYLHSRLGAWASGKAFKVSRRY